MKIQLFYDEECPFCNSYANFIKLKQNYELILLNAREYLENLEDLKLKGFNINDGFIIIVDEKQIYQGSEAIIFLNQLSKKKIHFPNNKFFTGFIYPLVKFIRKIVLKFLCKKIDIL